MNYKQKAFTALLLSLTIPLQEAKSTGREEASTLTFDDLFAERLVPTSAGGSVPVGSYFSPSKGLIHKLLSGDKTALEHLPRRTINRPIYSRKEMNHLITRNFDILFHTIFTSCLKNPELKKLVKEKLKEIPKPTPDQKRAAKVECAEKLAIDKIKRMTPKEREAIIEEQAPKYLSKSDYEESLHTPLYYALKHLRRASITLYPKKDQGLYLTKIRNALEILEELFECGADSSVDVFSAPDSFASFYEPSKDYCETPFIGVFAQSFNSFLRNSKTEDPRGREEVTALFQKVAKRFKDSADATFNTNIATCFNHKGEFLRVESTPTTARIIAPALFEGAKRASVVSCKAYDDCDGEENPYETEEACRARAAYPSEDDYCDEKEILRRARVASKATEAYETEEARRARAAYPSEDDYCDEKEILRRARVASKATEAYETEEARRARAAYPSEDDYCDEEEILHRASAACAVYRPVEARETKEAPSLKSAPLPTLTPVAETEDDKSMAETDSLKSAPLPTSIPVARTEDLASDERDGESDEG